MSENRLQGLARRAEHQPGGDLSITVREIRDVHWGTSRLTAKDRRAIDAALGSAGARATPQLDSGVGLDETVRITHSATKRAHDERMRRHERDRGTGFALLEELADEPGRRKSFTRGTLAQRFGYPGAAVLSSDDRSSIVESLRAVSILSEPPLSASGISWPDRGEVVLSSPRRSFASGPMKLVASAVAALLLIVVLVAAVGGGSNDDETAPASQSAAVVDGGSSTTETAESSAPQLKEAQAAEAREDYDAAIAAYVALGDEDEADRVRGLAAAVLVARARRAFNDGRYKRSLRASRTAIRKYGDQATGATRIRNQSTSRLQAAAERSAARAEAREAAAAARAEERRAAEAAAATPETDYSEPDYSEPDNGSGGVASGGRPGCDPLTARDGDGDGIVCE